MRCPSHSSSMMVRPFGSMRGAATPGRSVCASCASGQEPLLALGCLGVVPNHTSRAKQRSLLPRWLGPCNAPLA